MHSIFHSTYDTLDLPNSGKWRFRLGFPTKNVIVLVVTVPGGVFPNDILLVSSLFSLQCTCLCQICVVVMIFFPPPEGFGKGLKAMCKIAAVWSISFNANNNTDDIDIPIGSMHGIFTHIYHNFLAKRRYIYQSHGSYGIYFTLFTPRKNS